MVLKVMWVHCHVLHHINTILELSFKFKVEEHGTEELHDDNRVAFQCSISLHRICLRLIFIAIYLYEVDQQEVGDEQLSEGTEYGRHSYLKLLKACRSNFFVYIQFFKLLMVEVNQESQIIDALTILENT